MIFDKTALFLRHCKSFRADCLPKRIGLVSLSAFFLVGALTLTAFGAGVDVDGGGTGMAVEEIFLPITMGSSCVNEECFSAQPTAASEATSRPQSEPTSRPQSEPTSRPQSEPTSTPQIDPTSTPQIDPTSTPQVDPTSTPQVDPTSTPQVDPTSTPQVDPTSTPQIDPTSTPPAAPLVSGRNELAIEQTIDGSTVSRTVYIKTPQNLNSAQSYPLVFAFHGAGGSGNQFLNNSALNELINSGEFIGVYPNGHANAGINGGYWNLGSEPTTADDVEFINLIVQQLAAYSELDRSRMYALGFSNGAGMVNLLGKSTSHFNAIAPMFSHQLITTGTLTPPATLSVLQINGNNDNLIPINGGSSPVGEFMSAEGSALNWANEFNCSTTARQESLTWGSISLNSYTYANCDSDHEIKYLIALETGHGWANQEADMRSFNEVWSFFQEH